MLLKSLLVGVLFSIVMMAVTYFLRHIGGIILYLTTAQTRYYDALDKGGWILLIAAVVGFIRAYIVMEGMTIIEAIILIVSLWLTAAGCYFFGIELLVEYSSGAYTPTWWHDERDLPADGPGRVRGCLILSVGIITMAGTVIGVIFIILRKLMEFVL